MFVQDQFGMVCKQIGDGLEEPKEMVIQYPVIDRFHEVIKKVLQSEESIEEYVKKLLVINPQVIVITDEIGYGIVPIDAFEREYREMTGRVCCELAKNATEVWRVTCGIGTRIK